MKTKFFVGVIGVFLFFTMLIPMTSLADEEMNNFDLDEFEKGIAKITSDVESRSVKGQKVEDVRSDTNSDGKIQQPRGTTALLDDDVESGDLGYSTGGYEGFAIRTLGANSGSYSWDFGNGDYSEDSTNGALNYLTSPSLDLGNSETATLSFYHWRDFESDSTLWDGGNVKISTDGGSSWTLLSSPSPSYDGSASTGYSNPLASEQVWGYSATWEQVTIDLSSYCGETVNIRWEAGVDDYSTTDAGWRIDDILVTKTITYEVKDLGTLSSSGDGWNFVSFNLIADGDNYAEANDLEEILEDTEFGISGSYDKVQCYDSDKDRWYSYCPSRDPKFNDDITWDNTVGVWIHMTSDDTLQVEGTVPSSTDISLAPGWNMVSYPSNEEETGGVPSEINKVGYFHDSAEYDILYDNTPSDFTFEPGEGYWLYNDADHPVNWNVTNDITAPTVESTTPADGATNVAVSSDIIIDFSDKMDQQFTDASITISPSISYSSSWNTDGDILTIDPSNDLSGAYTVTVDTGAVDTAGNHIESDHSFDFTTEDDPVEYFAVIVGISDYESISDLSYCDEDATDIYNWLTNKWSSYTYTIEVYGDGHTTDYPQYDGDAYEDVIKGALDTMYTTATSNDICVYTTSGHGNGDGTGNSWLNQLASGGGGHGGDDGDFDDVELDDKVALSSAETNFVFIDHCYSGGMGPELLALTNSANTFCTTTCTEDGYGWDDPDHLNGAWTYQYFEDGWINGNGATDCEGNFDYAHSVYPHSGGDEAQEFDGDTGTTTYIW